MIILYYWHGGKIPDWRKSCSDRLKRIYKNAEIIESTGNIYDNAHSDKWRFEQCAKHENCLWVDNDIWLDEPLELTDRPAMADEYHTWHHSICWSGKNPKAFDVKSYKELYQNAKLGLIDKVKITGIHYGSTRDGQRTDRHK